jgi:hypothetical protein
VNFSDWNGPIVIRSPEYLKKLSELLSAHPNRVIHNSLLLLFVLDVLPAEVPPSPLMCARAVVSNESNFLTGVLNFWIQQMSVMPEASSLLYINQFSESFIRDAISRVSFCCKKKH